MLPFLIAAFVLAVAIVFLIVQNTTRIFVNFLAWQFEGSLAVLLFLAFLFGIISSLLFVIPLLLKRKLKSSGTKETAE
jgi:uncharacterized integral membrane protein